MTFTLVMIPGNGARQVTMSDSATVADLVSEYNLHDRSIFINGSAVAPSKYATTTLQDGAEVFANTAVKGA